MVKRYDTIVQKVTGTISAGIAPIIMHDKSRECY